MEENKKFQHPEGKIQLLNGTILDCYPLEQPQQEVNNQLALDTTGEYLSVGNKPHKTDEEKKKQADEEKELERLFTDNAFVFLENWERVFSDSRIFLCPLPVHSGLAYTGTGGFRNPTLGVYIEFWKNCYAANIMEKDGKKWLLWHMAGSPLSGSNKCGLVNPQGERKCQSITPFRGAWQPFIRINKRYDEAKSKYQAYTIREVLEIFENEGRTVAYRKSMQIHFLQQEINRLRQEVENWKKYNSHLYNEFRDYLFKTKRGELRAFYAEYLAKEKEVNLRVEEIMRQRVILRLRMKEGEIDNIQFQKLWMPLNKEKANILIDLNRFAYDSLREIVPEMTLSLYDVKNLLDEEDKTGHNEGDISKNS